MTFVGNTHSLWEHLRALPNISGRIWEAELTPNCVVMLDRGCNGLYVYMLLSAGCPRVLSFASSAQSTTSCSLPLAAMLTVRTTKYSKSNVEAVDLCGTQTNLKRT